MSFFDGCNCFAVPTIIRVAYSGKVAAAIFVDTRREIPLLSTVDLIVPRVAGLEILYSVVRLVFIDVIDLNGVFIVVPSPN